jgi:hypothetical protein
MFTVKPENTMNPYHDIIATMLEIEFPGQALNCDTVFEAVTQQLVGTKQARNGPTPSPETLVSIRSVVREAMRDNKPVPILVPWGASKQGNYGLDVAEVMALKQLECLRTRVTQHYEPGIDLRIRLEDTTDHILFPHETRKITEYVNSFRDLQKIVSPDTTVIAESLILDTSQWETVAELLQAAMDDDDFYATGQLDRDWGWKGGVPRNQRDYYLRTYQHLYPDETQEQHERRLAEYLAVAALRKHQNATGAAPGTTPLVLSFVNLARHDDHPRRLYYRTLPERYQHTHYAPWLGKGYIKITGREASPAVTHWSGGGLDYVPYRLKLTGNGQEATVQADYWVAS